MVGQYKYSQHYIGRFAPTPSGDLHLGSLFCAVVSYLDAKAHQGQWLLRIDDVDTPRIVQGASEKILITLNAHGLRWDQSVIYQSKQFEAYQAVVDLLLNKGKAFYCGLSRKELIRQYNGIHPGKQYRQSMDNIKDMALRLAIDDNNEIILNDRWAGQHRALLKQTMGAFSLCRRDQIYSYHLACVVDDYLSGITHIVRGRDLLSSTMAQIYIQQLLNYPMPSYAHHGLIINKDGQKLSKQHYAKQLTNNTEDNLRKVFSAIQLYPPSTLTVPEDLLRWASEQWNENHIKLFTDTNEMELQYDKEGLN